MRYLVCLLAIFTSNATLAGPAQDKMVAELQRLTGDGQIFQTMVAFVGPSDIHYEAFGDPAPDEDSLFEIGSITKVFTALLVSEAVRRGDLSWDQAIGTLVPSGIELSSASVEQITLRQLASHQSGLPRMPANFSPADVDNPYADYTSADMWGFLAGLEIANNKHQYAYSNLGAGLLGEIAARAWGKSYPAAIREQVLDPLEMEATYTLENAPVNKLLTGHAGKYDTAHWAFDVMAPAGALISSAADMARFVSLNLETDGTALAESLLAIRQVQGEAKSAGGNIALAWHVISSSSDRLPVFFHNGGTGGFRSVIAFQPDQGKGIVILTNSDTELTPLAINYMVGEPETPTSFPDELATSAAELEAYIGTYRLSPGAYLTVTRTENQLSAQLTGQASYPVFPFEPDWFFYKVVEARLHFGRDKSGAVDNVTLIQNGRELPAAKLPPEDIPKSFTEIHLTTDVLKQLEGQYQFSFGAKLTVQEIAGQLYATLSGQQRFPIFPHAPDNFFYRVVDAQLTFNRNTEGSVESVTLHQNGADQLAPRIIDPSAK